MSKFSEMIETVEASIEKAYSRADCPDVEVVRVTLKDGIMRLDLSRLPEEYLFAVDARYAANGMPLFVTNAGDRYSAKYVVTDIDAHAMFVQALRTVGLDR